MTNGPKASRRRITMKDVAAAAGASQSTVSFVLNGAIDMRISEETRHRVLAAADRLGYRTRTVGRPPATTSRGVIGLLIDEIATRPFAAISIDGAREEAWKSGALLEVATGGGDPGYEDDILRKWHVDGIDGVIYATILTRETTPPNALSRHRAVLLNCHDPADRFPSVVPAERRGGGAATRALLDVGHDRIAFISGEPWAGASRQRREGYEQAIRASGRSADPDLVVEGKFLPSRGYQATQRQIDRKADRPDAIFCANDLMAVGCYEALEARGERIGEIISVMGYGDQAIARHLSPQFSTALLPHREMGRWCACAVVGQEKSCSSGSNVLSCFANRTLPPTAEFRRLFARLRRCRMTLAPRRLALRTQDRIIMVGRVQTQQRRKYRYRLSGPGEACRKGKREMWRNPEQSIDKFRGGNPAVHPRSRIYRRARNVSSPRHSRAAAIRDPDHPGARPQLRFAGRGRLRAAG